MHQPVPRGAPPWRGPSSPGRCREVQRCPHAVHTDAGGEPRRSRVPSLPSTTRRVDGTSSPLVTMRDGVRITRCRVGPADSTMTSMIAVRANHRSSPTAPVRCCVFHSRRPAPLPLSTIPSTTTSSRLPVVDPGHRVGAGDQMTAGAASVDHFMAIERCLPSLEVVNLTTDPAFGFSDPTITMRQDDCSSNARWVSIGRARPLRDRQRRGTPTGMGS